MGSPQLHHVQCLSAQGLHKMAYWQWGDPRHPHVVVCVHGLSRQGRDFDVLAGELSAHARVVCPDVVGRGQSDWLSDPAGYALPTYVADMVTLLARLQAQTVDWVGTSMGGLIGLGVSALRHSPVRRLVLNDVGPALNPVALERIGQYLGVPRTFADLDEAADYLWSISRGFGPHTREQWLALSRHQIRQESEGRWTQHYDPSIAVPFRSTSATQWSQAEQILWSAYDSLTQQVLLLRGAESDLLSESTAKAMTQRGPRARLVEFAQVGHAPMLVQPEQRRAVVDFLLSG